MVETMTEVLRTEFGSFWLFPKPGFTLSLPVTRWTGIQGVNFERLYLRSQEVSDIFEATVGCLLYTSDAADE